MNIEELKKTYKDGRPTAHTCGFCPYNEGYYGGRTIGPCGQYHCWLELEDDDDYYYESDEEAD